ncbi:MAG TPA: protein translocase subunit SecF [Candidatus Absconditabacterales bacterium]|nr:protein translocase subunit SecF [Candidatus Absconditabacterales bacterium]
MKHSYVRVGFGTLLLAIALFLFFSNARYSEEFTGGVKISVAGTLDETTLSQNLLQYMDSKGYKDNTVAIEVEGDITKISLRTQVEKDEQVNALSQDIQAILVQKGYIKSTSEVVEQSITGPSVGAYMQKSAKNALIVGLILMAIYMLFSFAGIRKDIAPGLLAGVVIATMVFDVGIPAGAYGLWMALDKTIAIDTIFIIAVLTNMGYSINDTIIVFDRVRENMKNHTGQKGILFGKIFEQSIWQTMRRSFGTVLTTLLVIIAMYVLGSGVIKQFAFTIGIGVIAGSYSSIFIAAPLTYILLGKYRKERKEMLAQK